MILLPDHGVGAVIRTNADTGSFLVGLLLLRLLEVLFDGTPRRSNRQRSPCSSVLPVSPKIASGW